MQAVCRFVVAMPTQHYKAVWHVQCADLAGFLGPPCGRTWRHAACGVSCLGICSGRPGFCVTSPGPATQFWMGGCDSNCRGCVFCV